MNLFPDAELEEGDVVKGKASSLERLAELLRKQRIRDSAREVLLGSIRDNRMVFQVNKQAAYVGQVSFAASSPLGDITVMVEAHDIRRIVDEVAPPSFKRASSEPGPAA